MQVSGDLAKERIDFFMKTDDAFSKAFDVSKTIRTD